MTSLVELRIGSNQFWSTLPSELGNLVNLVTLDVSNQYYLYGSIPDSWSALTNLQHLNVFNNSIVGSISSGLGSLKALTYLALDSNQLSGSIPSEVGGLTNLVELRLGTNYFSGSVPPSLCSLEQLTVMTLDKNPYLGCYPQCLESVQFAVVKDESLSGCTVEPSAVPSSSPTVYYTLKTQQQSAVNDLVEAVSGSLPTTWKADGSKPCNWKGLVCDANSDLVSLDLSYTNAYIPSIPTTIALFTALTNLQLGFNGYTMALPSTLGQLSNLQSLGLQSMYLTGVIPTFIGKLSKLTVSLTSSCFFRPCVSP